MKQHITVEQLDELSEEGLKKISDWCSSKGWLIINLSIGQMIEFLDEATSHEFSVVNTIDGWKINFGCYNHDFNVEREEFCDALWQAVKKILEK